MLITLQQLLFNAEVTRWEHSLTGKSNTRDNINMNFDPLWINDRTFMRFQCLPIKGEGVVKYHLKMNDGTDIVIQAVANYIPDLKFILLSPQEQQQVRFEEPPSVDIKLEATSPEPEAPITGAPSPTIIASPLRIQAKIQPEQPQVVDLTQDDEDPSMTPVETTPVRRRASGTRQPPQRSDHAPTAGAHTQIHTLSSWRKNPDSTS